jgi:uncharacterized protein
MVTDSIKRFVEETELAFVASADQEGRPHLAAGRGIHLPDPRHLEFEAWFCRKTLSNVVRNPQVAITVTAPETGNGFQFIGRVESTADTAILDGFVPGLEPPGMPQVCSRLRIRIEEVMEFSADIHSDSPLLTAG